MKRLILLAIPVVLSAQDATLCKRPTSTESKKYYCNKKGEVIKDILLWKGSSTPNVIFTYQNRKVQTYQFFLKSGELAHQAYYYHQGNGTILKEHYQIKNKQMVLTEKYLYMPAVDNQKRVDYLIQEWEFSKEYKPLYINHLTAHPSGKRVFTRRDILDDNQEIEEFYTFSFGDNFRIPETFKRYNEAGDLVGSYNPDNFSAGDLYQRAGPTKNKTLIAIIDSDFDLNHSLLLKQVWVNPQEPIDGIDNDGNGWVDDAFGWNGARKSNNLLGTINFTNWGTPVSHGTHVASIAVEGRRDVAFIGFCHDFSRTSYIEKIAQEIGDKNIMFTNMSFSMGNGDSPLVTTILSASPKIIEAVNNIVESTPSTLHVIAAANAGSNIDQAPTFPASNEAPNTLVVGAITDDVLDPQQLYDYELTWFTNYGKYSVDVLAPGASLWGAAHGGGMVTYSGTSMATPYTLNHAVLEVHKTNPELSILEVKEVVMKSVYIRDLNNPFPVRSGGIIYPDRARAVALLLKRVPEMSIADAVIEVRRNEEFLVEGEEQTNEYFDKLKNFWNQGHSPKVEVSDENPFTP